MIGDEDEEDVVFVSMMGEEEDVRSIDKRSLTLITMLQQILGRLS
jgi:hypothetical protein